MAVVSLSELLRSLGAFRIKRTLSEKHFMNSGDVALWVSTVGTIVAAAYAPLSYHRPPAMSKSGATTTGSAKRPIFIMSALALMCWGSVLFDYFFVKTDKIEDKPLVLAWGATTQGGMYAFVDTLKIRNDAKESKLMLILRAEYANVDKMSDTHIEKSQTFSFDVPTITLGISGPYKNIQPLLGSPTQIEFDVVELPSSRSPQQIASLADVLSFGGKILASPSTFFDFTSKPDKVIDPQSANPQSVTQPKLQRKM